MAAVHAREGACFFAGMALCISLRAVAAAVAATLVGAVQVSARHQPLLSNRWQFVRYRRLAPGRLVPSFHAPVQLL